MRSGRQRQGGFRPFCPIVGRCAASLFLHSPDKTDALPRQCLEEALLFAGIADRIPGGVQAGRQSSIRYNASIPNGNDQVVLANDALPVSNQVIEQVKNLRCDWHRIRPAVQFTLFSIKRVIFEEIAQVAIPSGVTSRPPEHEE